MQARNFLLFIAATILIIMGWWQIENRFFPAKPREKKPDESVAKKDGDQPAKPDAEPPKPPVKEKREDPPAKALKEPEKPTPENELISLGSADPNSRYHLLVRFDPKGAGVWNIVLNKFKAGDELGRPTDRLLELVPAPEYARSGAFQLFHYDDPNDEFPRDTLGKVKWDKIDERTEAANDEHRERQIVTFRAAVKDLQITKTYSLTEGEYHLGLEVRVKRTDSAEGSHKIRYQLAGAHGLPVEGKWYTSVFRNALIARIEKNSVIRDIQDLRQISSWGGGKPILKEKDQFIRYAGVAVQYFASVIVVDDEQVNGQRQDFLTRAKATLETYVLKGYVKAVSEKGALTFDFVTDDQKEEKIYVSPLLIDTTPGGNGLVKGQRIAVVAMTDSHGRTVALELADHDTTQPLWRDDITVRVTTEAIELKKPGDPGDEVVHKYLLYNGPIKPMLLGMPGHESVPEAVIEKYVDKLKLNTLTDYHSPGPFGTFSNAIYWTDLIIKCTNLMHWVLSEINRLIPNYGVCIICLTVLVRGLMFPISRKQAMMSIKMQELAPEMKKLQEKHKGDRQAAGMATMELYRKHGVNPFGTCWFILLQMPIFMGLYFALQESTYFRLAGAWPTWIKNLAAPDMMLEWGESIPWLSRPQDYGGFLYLGPFFNVLPLIAVALMIVQQKMMTPPPQDEQQEMQQKIMKYMMIFFGLLFYKVAAGLCIYFIASSLWGFTERKLLPKKKLHAGIVSADAALQQLTTSSSGQASTAVTVASGITSARGRKQGRVRKRQDGDKPEQDDADGTGSTWSRFRRRVSDWWAGVLKKAEKK